MKSLQPSVEELATARQELAAAREELATARAAEATSNFCRDEKRQQGTSRVISIATALPDLLFDIESSIDHVKRLCSTNEREARLVERLYHKSGIEHRGSVLARREHDGPKEDFFTARLNPDDKCASQPSTAERLEVYRHAAADLARKAADSALHQSGVARQAITHTVTASCTGFVAPGFDIELIDHLGLNRDVQRTHIGFMGCHGIFNALRVADALARSTPGSCILVCAAEICTIHFQTGWNPDHLVANSLFADGAAAAIVAAQLPSPSTSPPSSLLSPSLPSLALRSQLPPPSLQPTSTQRSLALIASTSLVVAHSKDSMTWTIGDTGFLMTLSAAVPDLIEINLKQWLEPWLHRQGTAVESINGWAIHPGGKRILDSVQSALQLTDEQMLPSRTVLRDFGNMSSPTVLFIIDHLLSTGTTGSILMLGFGPGLTFEAMLLDVAVDVG